MNEIPPASRESEIEARVIALETRVAKSLEERLAALETRFVGLQARVTSAAFVGAIVAETVLHYTVGAR